MSKLQQFFCNAVQMVDNGRLEAGHSAHYGLLARGLMLYSAELDGDCERFYHGLNGDADHAALLRGLMAGVADASQLLTLLANAWRLAAEGQLLAGQTEHIGTVARALCDMSIDCDGDREKFDGAMCGDVRYVGRLRRLLRGVCRPSNVYGDELALFA